MADRLINQVLGRYEILSAINEGGMGKLYLAEHIFTGKKIALKTLRLGWLADLKDSQRREIEERFRREAQAAAQIAHENVVEIYDFDIAKENNPAYIAMEFIQGESLEKILEREGKYLLENALPLMIQISEGIAEAHKKGFIHRDLKPPNIMVIASKDNIRKERIKIVDFGITKVFNSSLTKITQQGQILGTPTHIPPEQWDNKGIEIDERADVYALGLIFYEMLSGVMPFQSNSFEGWITCHLYDRPKPLSNDIPKPIEEIIMQSLEKDREQRPKSAIELKNRLVKIEKDIQKQKQEQEMQVVGHLKEQLKNSLEWSEYYKKKLESSDSEIKELTEENIKLKEELTQLSERLKDGRNDSADEISKPNSFSLLTAVISDKGLSEKRPQNEDSYLNIPERGLFAVADGGGKQAGEVASQMALEIFDASFSKRQLGDDIEESMEIAISQANSSIFQLATDLPQFSTMATTIVSLHIAGNIATIGHIGDSRLYRIDPKRNLYRETHDHRVIEEEVLSGRMTREQADRHPLKAVLSRALGAKSAVKIDVKTIMFEPNTTFLLCSDGITRHITDIEIRELLILPHPPAQICHQIKEICYSRGAEDNFTAVVIKVLDKEGNFIR